MRTSVVARIGVISLLVVGMGVAFMMTRREGINANAVVNWLRSFGHASPLTFVGIYTVARYRSQ